MIKRYEEYQNDLKNLRNEMNAINFNIKLFYRMIVTVYLASYIKHLLFQEIDKVEVFSWLSDRDKITSMSKGIYSDLFAIISHCVCALHLPEEKWKGTTEVLPDNTNEKMLWDSLNRIPDIICGIISDHNLVTNEVSKDKHLEGVEGILADNPNIMILSMKKNGIARISHMKI